MGHATVLVEVEGVHFLTDPALTPRLAHLRRRRPLPPGVLDRVDVVLVSHLHMDHLHLPSLRLLDRRTTVVIPRGGAGLVARIGFEDVREITVGETLQFGRVGVMAVPAAHDRRRGPHARVRAEPIGYVIGSGATSVYFPGDTDLFDGMRELAGVGLALLPIWGWGSNIGEGHLDPERAAHAVELLDPGTVTPIHWGTYSPMRGTRRPPAWLAHPPSLFRAELAPPLRQRLQVVPPGGSLELPARSQR